MVAWGRLRRNRDRDGDLRHLTEQALLLQRSGDDDAAEALFQRCWQADDPEWSAQAGTELGKIFLRRGAPGKASAVLRQAVEVWGHPTHGAEAMVWLGQALAQTGDLAGARRQYELVIDLNPPLFRDLARFQLAEQEHRQGDKSVAEGLYQAVATGDDATLAPRAAVNLGVLYTELGQWDQARAAFSSVLDSNDQQQAAMARQNLAALDELAKGTPPPPVDGTDDQRADLPGSGEAAAELGAQLYERGQIAEAEAALRHADRLGDAMGTFRLGFLLVDTGRVEEGLDAYRRAAALGSQLAMTNLGYQLERRGDSAGARAAYEQVLGQPDSDPELLDNARRRIAALPVGNRPVPPAWFDPEASVVDSVLWVAGDSTDARVQRARAFVLAELDPPLRRELAELIARIDRGAVDPAQVSIAPYLSALYQR